MAKKPVESFFDDAVVKPKGPKPDGKDCVYVDGDSGLPLVFGEKYNGAPFDLTPSGR
jgi:hypothetical protein